jgi:prevent-host-death family protein
MDDGHWSLAEAKAKFSELFERALTEGPQTVLRRGKDAVVLIRQDELARRSRPPETLHDFFERSPLRGSGIELERMKGPMRDFDV